MRKNTASSCVQ